jgi:hypothetical protein
MSDLPSALGIEAVELVAEGGRSVTVRVTGRWRRRRPELRGQAMLVVETGTVRQRFVAMPEPPSLIGAAPGTWRLSFTVPTELASQLAGKTSLQLGAVMVPLPVGEAPPPAAEHPDSELLEARQLRSSELAAESARRRATEAEATVAELKAQVAHVEDELARAREESDRLRHEIAERARRLRSSEQDVHAERARRGELEQALARKTRAAGHDLQVLHEHVADLERELGRMRRAVDEEQHLAAAAEARRADAERRLEERAPPPTPDPPAPEPPAPEPPPPEPPAPRVEAARMRLMTTEFALAGASMAAPRAPAHPRAPARSADGRALRLESAMVERRTAGMERELAGARGELAEARRDLADARHELERQRLLNVRAYDAIDKVRGELARLGGEAPTQQAVRTPAPPAPLQAEKLSAALARLRETTPTAAATPPAAGGADEQPTPTAARPASPAKPWLGKAFRTLANRDPSSAGRLLLALLPAQRAADPRPIAYDLVLGDLAAARVTVSRTGAQVDLGDTPRPTTEVDFQLVGDLASIARLLAAGPWRRRLGRLGLGPRMARVRGDRARLRALEHLLSAPLTLGQLRAAGVGLDPLLAMTLAAAMIEPDWTRGERFTIAHREPHASSPDAHLHIRDAGAAIVTAEPPHGPVATTIECAADELLVVLGGEQVALVAISGDQRPLALVRQWLDRAQCG